MSRGRSGRARSCTRSGPWATTPPGEASLGWSFVSMEAARPSRTVGDAVGHLREREVVRRPHHDSAAARFAAVLQKREDSLARAVAVRRRGLVAQQELKFLARARAMATRCCSLPESCAGSCRAGRRAPPGRARPRRAAGRGRSGSRAPRSRARSGSARGCRTGRRSRCRGGGTCVSSRSPMPLTSWSSSPRMCPTCRSPSRPGG